MKTALYSIFLLSFSVFSFADSPYFYNTYNDKIQDFIKNQLSFFNQNDLENESSESYYYLTGKFDAYNEILLLYPKITQTE